MTSKSDPKKVLFDSKTLQGMLGLNPSVLGNKPTMSKTLTKADRKAQRKATLSQTREYNRMVESIVLEETGQVVIRLVATLFVNVCSIVVVYMLEHIPLT